MERRKFVKQCCLSSVALPFGAAMLNACASLHYAQFSESDKTITLSKKEFVIEKESGPKQRKFVLVKSQQHNFPICVVPTAGSYTASLMKCTHRGCELNIGGGIYSCPCHGSEFTLEGEVLQGPAIERLTTFEIETDNDNIYIKL